MFHSYEAEEPEGGWKTFSQFFYRKLNPVLVPLLAQTMAASSYLPPIFTFAGAYLINEKSEVTLKVSRGR